MPPTVAAHLHDYHPLLTRPIQQQKKQNVDCCKYDYKSNPKCSWPNTPVSFRVAGTCQLNGATYPTLSQSNSQGPPGGVGSCRCATALPAKPTTKPYPAPSAPAPATKIPAYRVVSGYDIPGKDIPSGGQPFTRICAPASGGYRGKYGSDAYALMCADTKGCVAAVTERASSGCAYMKTSGAQADLKPAADWVSITSQLPAAKPCVYANIGEKCTTDPFVDQPICCGGNKNPCVNGVCQSGYPPSGRR